MLRILGGYNTPPGDGAFASFEGDSGVALSGRRSAPAAHSAAAQRTARDFADATVASPATPRGVPTPGSVGRLGALLPAVPPSPAAAGGVWRWNAGGDAQVEPAAATAAEVSIDMEDHEDTAASTGHLRALAHARALAESMGAGVAGNAEMSEEVLHRSFTAADEEDRARQAWPTRGDGGDRTIRDDGQRDVTLPRADSAGVRGSFFLGASIAESPDEHSRPQSETEASFDVATKDRPLTGSFDDQLRVTRSGEVLWTTAAGSVVRKSFRFERTAPGGKTLIPRAIGAPTGSAQQAVWAWFPLAGRKQAHGAARSATPSTAPAGISSELGLSSMTPDGALRAASSPGLEAQNAGVDDTLDRCLCVLHQSDRLLVHSPSGGETYRVALPFATSAIAPLPVGILLQKEVSASVDARAGNAGTNGTDGGDGDRGEGVSMSPPPRVRRRGRRPMSSDAPLEADHDMGWDPHPDDRQHSSPEIDSSFPVLFSLAHPLEEPKPVCSVVTAGGTAVDAEVVPRQPIARFFDDDKERVIAVLSSLAMPMIVTFNTGSRRHSVWLLHAGPHWVPRPSSALLASVEFRLPDFSAPAHPTVGGEVGPPSPTPAGFPSFRTPLGATTAASFAEILSDSGDASDDGTEAPEGIRPEAFVQKVWTDVDGVSGSPLLGSTAATSVFDTRDVSAARSGVDGDISDAGDDSEILGRLSLCLHFRDAEQLHVLSCKQTIGADGYLGARVSLGFSKSAIAAAPIDAFHGQGRDLIVLSPSPCCLQVFCGPEKLATVGLLADESTLSLIDSSLTCGSVSGSGGSERHSRLDDARRSLAHSRWPRYDGEGAVSPSYGGAPGDEDRIVRPVVPASPRVTAHGLDESSILSPALSPGSTRPRQPRFSLESGMSPVPLVGGRHSLGGLSSLGEAHNMRRLSGATSVSRGRPTMHGGLIDLAGQVVGLGDSVGSRVSVALESGRVLRVELDLAPTSPLTQACLAAADVALGLQAAMRLRADVARMSNALQSWIAGMHLEDTSASRVRALEVKLLFDSAAGGSDRSLAGSYSIAVPVQADAPDFQPAGAADAYDVAAIEWHCFVALLRGLSLAACGDEAERPSSHEVHSRHTSSLSGMSSEPSDADWESLLQSTFHASYRSSLPLGDVAPTTAAVESSGQVVQGPDFHPESSPGACGRQLRSLFAALHYVYEDLKLSAPSSRSLRPLGSLLAGLGAALRFSGYVDLYLRDLGMITCPRFPSAIGDLECGDGSPGTPIVVQERPPNVLGYLLAVVRGRDSHAEFEIPPSLTGVCTLATRIVHIFRTIANQRTDDGDGDPVASAHAAQAVVLQLVAAGFTKDDIDKLPFGLAVPLLDSLRTCRSNPPSRWPPEAYSLIGRDDLAALFGTPQDGMASRRAMTIASERQRPSDDGERPEDDVDALDQLEETTALRFGRDRRVREVARMLRSSRISFVPVGDEASLSDIDLVAAQQLQLLRVSRRLCGVCVGRGALTLATESPSLIAPVKVPAIVLAARMPPNNAVINLDMSNRTDAERLLDWPSFHNACAAGLRVSTCSKRLRRSWIKQHKPAGSPTFAHGGLLLAMGLRGLLSSLRVTDIYDYVSQGHEGTTVGALLGMAATRAGTGDAAVNKALCLHLPAILPVAFADIAVPSTVQCCSLVGLGLLHRSTAHRLTTEFLLQEIGRRAVTQGDLKHREAYALSAGMALGLVTLGRGGVRDAGLADLRLHDKLYRFIAGGKDPGARPAMSDPTTVSRVLESDQVNVGVTAPAATLALTMMYLKTNNTAVSDSLAVPDTLYLLDTINPDVVLLRVCGRALVMWHETRADADWLLSQIPLVLREHLVRLGAEPMLARPTFGSDSHAGAEERKQGDSGMDGASTVGLDPDVDYDSVRQQHAMCLAGACLALGLRFAGTGDPGARRLLTVQLRHFQLLRDHGVATASAAAEVAAAADDVGEVGYISPWIGTPEAAKACAPAPSTIETCTGAVAIALSLVMAGSGDVRTLRIFRELRACVHGGVHFGHHMLLGMASGFLFLGAGRATFGRSNEAIAALLLSVFPRVPHATDDNQFHPQPLRHLYAMAVDWRCLSVHDVDSGEACHVPLEVTLRTGSGSGGVGSPHSPLTTLKLVSPCLLPPVSEISRVRLCGPRYWSYELDIEGNPSHARALSRSSVTSLETARGPIASLGVHLWAKRSVGHLDYTQDPRGRRAVGARGLPANIGLAAGADVPAFVRGYTEHPALTAFAKYFCSAAPTDLGHLSHTTAPQEASSDPATDVLQSVCIAAIEAHTAVVTLQPDRAWVAQLSECLVDEKPEALAVYFAAHNALSLLPSADNSMDFASLALLLAHVEASSESIISASFVTQLRSRVSNFLRASGFLTERSELDGQSVVSSYALHCAEMGDGWAEMECAPAIPGYCNLSTLAASGLAGTSPSGSQLRSGAVMLGAALRVIDCPLAPVLQQLKALQLPPLTREVLPLYQLRLDGAVSATALLALQPLVSEDGHEMEA